MKQIDKLPCHALKDFHREVDRWETEDVILLSWGVVMVVIATVIAIFVTLTTPF